MRRYAIVGAVVLVVGGGAAYHFLTSRQPAYIFAPVERGPITQKVSASGNVAAPDTIDLQFQQGGKLTGVGVVVGESVLAGEVLARQDTSVLHAQLQQAQAAEASAQAKLDALEAGTRPESIAVSEAQVQADQTALSQARQALIDAIEAAYTQADDAVHTKADQFFTQPKTAYASVTLSAPEGWKATVERERVAIEPLLASWQASNATLSTQSDLARAASEAAQNLATIAQFLTDSNSMLTAITDGTDVSVYTALVSAARTSINTAASTLTSAQTSVAADAATLEKDQKSLALAKAGSTPQDIAAQQAAVAQAKANVSAIQAQIAQFELIAPVAGTVTAVNGSPGEAVAPNATVISILPNAKLQVDVNLSEVNVANVQVGQRVDISLDAFPDDEWQGVVSSVDPAQTIIGGAVYYKTTVLFSKSDPRIKAGMTANVLIETGTASSTLVVPQSALQQDGTNTYVEVSRGGSVEKQNVQVGLKSKEGQAEILSGLEEGSRVVIGQ